MNARAEHAQQIARDSVRPMTIATAAYTGLDLKVLRIRSHVEGRAVAAQMGVNRSRVSAIEALARPSDQIVERYLKALEAAAR